jgi:hypothetical protein
MCNIPLRPGWSVRQARRNSRAESWKLLSAEALPLQELPQELSAVDGPHPGPRLVGGEVGAAGSLLAAGHSHSGDGLSGACSLSAVGQLQPGGEVGLSGGDR